MPDGPALPGKPTDGLAHLPEPGVILFDLDGTLVDTVEARIEGWLDTFREESLPASPELVAPLIGADGRRLARDVAARSGRRLDDAEAERIDRRAGEHYDRRNRDPRPHRDAPALLAALSDSSLRWAIATSSRAEQVMRSVEALGLPDRPMIIDGSHVAQAKPAPDLLLLAAERLSVPAERCWYVGDSTWDMAAARAAGMVAVGVSSGSATAAALIEAGAHAALERLEELRTELWRRGRLSVEDAARAAGPRSRAGPASP
ncbi:MAG TPA: HAD family hydrolase [Candidatus Limnocylindrales bacterium]|nr:HAD family hydrolase [Candidatus Limnocylindrales bacterium]